MRLRQIALVAHDLAAARAEISGVLGLDYAYDDPGVGKYGYMVILQGDDLAEARARVRDAGARVVDQTNKDGAAFTHIHPKDVGGAILSIDHMIPKERWEWGGPHWADHARTDVSVAIVGAELQAEDPTRMAARWAAVLGRTAQQSDGEWRIDLDEGEIRFVQVRDGRGE